MLSMKNDSEVIALDGDNASATSRTESFAGLENSKHAHDANGKGNLKGHTQQKQNEKLLFKIHEAAPMLGVSTASVRRLISRGELAVNRKLRHVLIPRAELERFACGGGR